MMKLCLDGTSVDLEGELPLGGLEGFWGGGSPCLNLAVSVGLECLLRTLRLYKVSCAGNRP